MNFSQANSIHGGLPQFSEITPKSGTVSSGDLTAAMQQAQNAIYTTAAASMNHVKQPIMASQQNKYPGSLVGWPDPNTLMQLCEKQTGIQTINIPNYNSQNNSSLLGTQPNSLPLRIIPNMYLPASTHSDSSVVKHESPQMRHNSGASLNSNSNSSSNVASQMQLQQQSAAMAEYLQKLQATTLPLTLQQLIKLQSEPLKREKIEEDEKLEQTANNILNIPSVPVFRNGHHLQNGNNHFMNAENMMMEINPHDLNVHMENSNSPEVGRAATQIDSQTQTQGDPMKSEQQMQSDATKSEKKMKFRAKTGEIKIALGLDGSMLYCCPECSLAFSEKADIEQHIQNHVQERKYQCKECGAMLKRKEHLDQHMRGHSDERPFKCPVCQKAFKRNEHLTRHYVIHSGDKNFTCTVCAKAFSRKDHLNKHTQTHLGIKRTKTGKKDASTMENSGKDISETSPLVPPIDEASLLPKQELSFLQHIHHLQKDQNFIQTFSAFKEQALKESIGSGGMLQQQAVNMNEILPQNARLVRFILQGFVIGYDLLEERLSELRIEISVWSCCTKSLDEIYLIRFNNQEVDAETLLRRNNTTSSWMHYS